MLVVVMDVTTQEQPSLYSPHTLVNSGFLSMVSMTRPLALLWGWGFVFGQGGTLSATMVLSSSRTGQ